ncbi:hypothetical protein SAMN04488554_0622 [Ruania alba]|uniref:Uncharacterized protein n=1 Tax=Ruania alba TaxID=648782 RepID=A0A1H5DAX7_9MICO|nr:hypothetical protein SAMN04488554_0622 [Ruania alba]
MAARGAVVARNHTIAGKAHSYPAVMEGTDLNSATWIFTLQSSGPAMTAVNVADGHGALARTALATVGWSV